jgi:hypothetical protein
MKCVLLLLLTMMTTPSANDLDQIADRYVQLVLAVGVRDSDYVDAYFGSQEPKLQAEEENLSYAQIASQTDKVLAQLDQIKNPDDEMAGLRYDFLKKQLEALRAFVELRSAKHFTFDQESMALYDAVAPTFSQSHFDEILHHLDTALPGKGDVLQRFEAYQKQFVIPREKLDLVFKKALKECRARTIKHIALPPNESFEVEYVRKKPWGGYNWYKGNFHSVIQVNTDLPIYIDRAVDLAAHEGYPGHHVYNVLLEQELLKKRNWKEFSVYPLFSPESLIAEGSANYGVDVVLAGEERIKFEQRVIFPAAGLDPSLAPQYYKVRELINQLTYAGNEAARHFLDGNWSAEQAIEWMQKYCLYSRDRAEKRLEFIKKYRSYVINYNLGQDMVKAYIESRAKDEESRWRELAKMLGSPILPSGIVLKNQ